jgi:hypothetical protein
MTNGDSNNSNNSVAIVALIIIGALIAGAVFIYAQGGFGPTRVIERDTKVIEKPVPAPEPAPEEKAEEPKEEPGYEFRHEDEDGNTTEIEAPAS